VLLPSTQAYSPLKTALRRLLAWMFPAPDLVLLLDVPGHIAFGRKGEYDAEHMEVHRQHLLALQAHLPQVRTVDATRTKDEVRAHATDLIWQEYVRRWTAQ
jgi:thymidylate kinase